MHRIRRSGTSRRSTRYAFEAFGLEQRRLMTYAPTIAAYRVNPIADGTQAGESTAVGPDGTTTIVWTDSALDSDGNGIYARRVDASGKSLGGQFRVNTVTEGNQDLPLVGADAQGGLVVLWREDQSYYGTSTLTFQRYDATGAKVGGNAPLTGVTSVTVDRISLQVLPDGAFVVVGSDPNGTWFRRYDSAGVLQSSTDLTLTHPGWSSSYGYYPLPMALTSTGLVLTWSEFRTRAVPDVGTLNDGRIWMRRIDLDGQAIGSDVLVTARDGSTSSTDTQNFKPAVTPLSDGGSLVTWYDYGADGSAYVGRRFGASGAPNDRIITFSPKGTASYGRGDTVTVTELANGNLLALCVQELAFEGDTSDFRVFSPEGDPVTARVPLPSITAYYLGNIRLAATGGSRFLVSWSDSEVYLQGFADQSTTSFSASTQSVDESAGSVTITVTRDGSAAAPASVRYSTLSESASSGADYTSSSAVLNFAVGQSSTTFSIPILRDTLFEWDETFLVTLGDPVGVALGDFASLRVTILDNPDGTGPAAPTLYIDRGAAGLWSWSPGKNPTLANAWDPEGYVVAADGRLFVDFGPHGLWTGFGSDLTQLNAANPEQLLVARDGRLFVDYGPFGLWRRDASGFALINGANPEGFAAPADGSLYVDFGPYGLWRRELSGSIAQINAANPEGMAATPDGTLFVDFGPYGFWRRDRSGIIQVNPANPESLAAAADGSVFVDFGPFGLWRWNGGFARINPANPEALAPAADGSIYIDYGSFGLWRWTASGFVQLNSGDPEGLTSARDGFIYIDFGPSGVWRRGPAGDLEKIDPIDPQGLAG